MRKLIMTLLFAGLVSVPLAAQEKQPQDVKKMNPAMQRVHGHEDFAKAHKEHRAKMKATQEKMGKLVKEYNKLKEGKKKEAKRAEIEKEVAAIHEEQLKFKAQQLVKFEQRLGEMKTHFAQENSSDGKKAWVDEKTQKLIDNNGDVRSLFAPQFDENMQGPRGHGPRGPRHGKDPRFGKRPGQQPPADELPVERPAEK